MRSWLVNLPKFLAPFGWGQPTSPTPSHKNTKMAYPELGFPHRAGRYRPEGPPISSPVCWSCRCVEWVDDPGMEPYPTQVALPPRTPANQRSASGSRLSHGTGQYRPGGPPFSSLVFCSCRCMHTWYIHDTGVGPYPTRVALALPTPARGLHIARGGIDTGDHPFCPQFGGFEDVSKDL